jgi:shikimate kinase
MSDLPTTQDGLPQAELDRAARIRAALGGRSIVLVGMMGAGKTSVGKRLAQRLSLPFVDADYAIEEAAAKTIPEIFAHHGEAYFRDGERRVIGRLLKERAQVLATGGGAYMNPETRNAIAAHGISVWLKAEVELLFERVRRRANRGPRGDAAAAGRRALSGLRPCRHHHPVAGCAS